MHLRSTFNFAIYLFHIMVKCLKEILKQPKLVFKNPVNLCHTKVNKSKLVLKPNILSKTIPSIQVGQNLSKTILSIHDIQNQTSLNVSETILSIQTGQNLTSLDLSYTILSIHVIQNQTSQKLVLNNPVNCVIYYNYFTAW